MGKKGNRVALAHFTRRAWLNASVIEPLEFFRTMKIFAGLENAQLQRLAASAVPRQLRCGQVLVDRLSEASHVHLIQKGELQISADLHDKASLQQALGNQPAEFQTPDSVTKECVVRGFDVTQNDFFDLIT